MANRITAFWERLRSSYWFIPSVMALLAIALSVVTIEVDNRYRAELANSLGFGYVESPEGAREILSTVASSMITVAGVVFSLTMVVLSLTSQQYGPLVLGNYMRDRGNQLVLGTFTATFIYCLLVLRAVRGIQDNTFVPRLSVTVGFVLALASLGVLIYFIHHVSDSLRSSRITDRIADNLEAAINDMYPQQIGTNPQNHKISDTERLVSTDFDQRAASIRNTSVGYLQMIDNAALLEVATKHDLIIKLRVHPGDFLLPDQPIAQVLHNSAQNSQRADKLTKAINETLITGSQRTQNQDIEFLFDQIVQIAVHALSPAINDPFTAIMCINQLGRGLCLLGNRQMPSPFRYDQHGNLRMVATTVTFDQLLHNAFDQIRHYGDGDQRVIRHLRETLDSMEASLHNEGNRQIVMAYHQNVVNDLNYGVLLAEAGSET
ncbi:MAG: DUF2254 domain-containing protein [Anaerolineae bacterium]|nr:DUF2254 domain-containing protein [Anaerolineae bacterium]